MLNDQIYKSHLRDNAERMKETLRYLADTDLLITGSSGLIGSAMVDFLAYIDENLGIHMKIYAAGRDTRYIKDRFGIWKNVYPLQYVAEEFEPDGRHFDYIIHCAGSAHPEAFRKTPVETMRVNFIGMDKILECAVKSSRPCRVLYVSSSEVYGRRPESRQTLYTEDNYYMVDVLNARGCYPSSKRAAENLCSSYIEEYGADVVIARPGHVYGATMQERDSRASSKFVQDVLEGKDIIMKSPGDQLRSYCYVMDCVTAMTAILVKGSCGEAYNISNDDSIVTIRQFADELAGQTGRSVIFQNPSDEEKKGYNLMDISALDAGKLKTLGWRGMYGLKEGIDATLKMLGVRKY